MSQNQDWQAIVASSLDWDQAHATFDASVEGLAPALRGVRPDRFPHSVWELVEHIRIAQTDLLDFCRNANYRHDMKWPDDYWAATPAPASEAAWEDSLAAIRRDVAALKGFTTGGSVDLTARIPHGSGQTYLRTVLVSADHMAYHVGQIIAVRRLLDAWP